MALLLLLAMVPAMPEPRQVQFLGAAVAVTVVKPPLEPGPKRACSEPFGATLSQLESESKHFASN